MTCFETVLLDSIVLSADVLGGLSYHADSRLSPGCVGTAGCSSELGIQSEDGVGDKVLPSLSRATPDGGGRARE